MVCKQVQLGSFAEAAAPPRHPLPTNPSQQSTLCLTSSSREGDTAPCTSCPVASWPSDRACKMSRIRRPTPEQDKGWVLPCEVRGAARVIGSGCQASRGQLHRGMPCAAHLAQSAPPDTSGLHTGWAAFVKHRVSSANTCKQAAWIHTPQHAAPAVLAFTLCPEMRLHRRFAPFPSNRAVPPPTNDAAVAVAHGADAVQRAGDAGLVVGVEQLASCSTASCKAAWVGKSQVAFGTRAWQVVLRRGSPFPSLHSCSFPTWH